MVVDVNPVDGGKAPKFKQKTRGVQGDPHASAKRMDECFCMAISGLFTSIRCLFFDVFLQEVTVDRLCKVLAGSIREENGRFVTESCNGALDGRQEFVLGLVELDAHEP